MQKFDMTPTGLRALADEIEAKGGIATRSEQAVILIAALKNLTDATNNYVDAATNGEVDGSLLMKIRSMVEGTAKLLDSDFSEILKESLKTSQSASLHGATMFSEKVAELVDGN